MLDDWKRGFTVKIPKTDNVSILKGEIKKENAPDLDHIPAKDLDLFLLAGDDAEETFKKTDRQPLNYLSRLSQLFPFVEENSLHIVIEVPAKGEFI